MRVTSIVAGCMVGVLGAGAMAHATDRPIDGFHLVLEQVGTKAKLIFLSRDPGALFPTIGGPDDPATGTPGGMTIELFSQNQGRASLSAGPGVGNPGWTAQSNGVALYKFKNRMAPAGISPVQGTVLEQGKLLKVVARSSGLSLAAPQGAVGIRITIGTLRNCALFTASTVRRDVAGSFQALHAASANLHDCSDESLVGGRGACEVGFAPSCDGECPDDSVCAVRFGACTCISPTTPCGQTQPVCNGACGDGEECIVADTGVVPSCVCSPTGPHACGVPGPPVCGGDCANGEVCRPVAALLPTRIAFGCACARRRAAAPAPARIVRTVRRVKASLWI